MIRDRYFFSVSGFITSVHARGQYRSSFLVMGWNDPGGHFGHEVVGKSGVVPAHSGVLPAPKFFVVHSTTFMLFNTFVHP